MRTLLIAAALAASPHASLAAAPAPIHYRTAKVDGIDLFYREAGPKDAPVLVLLHGRQTSSHMFRELIPLLATRYRVIAPDLPGFGQSGAPPPAQFAYTFDHLGAVVRDLLRDLHVGSYGLVMHDWGVPLGFRLAVAAPKQVRLLVVQNGVICEDPDRGPVWLDPYWETRDAAAETRLRNSYRLATTIKYHQIGAASPDRVSPDGALLDQYYLDQPGRKDIQAELMYDFGRSNRALQPQWRRYLAQYRPPLLVLWGKDSPVYSPGYADCYTKADPNAAVHFYKGGHFLLDEYAEDAARRILAVRPRAEPPRRR